MNMPLAEQQLAAASEGWYDGVARRESASILVLMFQGYAISAAYDEGYEAGLERPAFEPEWEDEE